MASRARQATIESSSLLFITDLNTALLVERSLTAAISYISSASVMLECWQNLSKLTNQRVYQILVYWNDRTFTVLFSVYSVSMFQLRKVDNWKPQAGGHVTGLCRRSLSGRNDLLLSFPTGVPSLPLVALFFICSRAVFCTAPWLTERLEEASVRGTQSRFCACARFWFLDKLSRILIESFHKSVCIVLNQLWLCPGLKLRKIKD